MIAQKTTKQIHKEWEQRRFKQLTRGYGDVVWLRVDDLKKEIEKRIEITKNPNLLDSKEFLEGMRVSYHIIINLCNSQEQKLKTEDAVKSTPQRSVSCEHNTGEEEINKLDSRYSLLEKVASPVQNPKKCTCKKSLKIYNAKEDKEYCGCCGGDL